MHNRESSAHRLTAITELICLNWQHSPFTAQISSAIRGVFQPLSKQRERKMFGTLTNFLVLSAVIWVTTNAEGGFKSSIITDNQIYFSKAPRFIKFDSKDDEVEIELGVSIPVVKVPLSPPLGRGEKKESGVTVSAPGLVVAGVLMLTTFLIVPFLFSKKTYRTGKTDEVVDIWHIVREIETGFHTHLMGSPSCVEYLLCWAAKATKDGLDGSPEKMGDAFRSKWMERLVNGTFAEKAILTGRSSSDCWEKYSCPLLKKLHNNVRQKTKAKK